MKKYRICNICEAMCGIEVEVENNQAVAIRPDKLDPFSQGHICPKAYALKDVHEDPDRLRYPIRKINGDWKQISWAEAFQFTASRLLDIQEQYGKDALGIYQGNPSVHNIGTIIGALPFFKTLQTKNRYSATSLDQLPHHLAAEYMFGSMHMIPIPDLNRTQFWLILGGNPVVSNGSMMTAPDVVGQMRGIQDRGGKVVVIDPRFTRTARKASQHIFIRPGTDIWLLLAMINYIIKNKRIALEATSSVINQEQISQIEKVIEPYNIEKAAAYTGIDTQSIVQLFEDFLGAESAVIYGRLGVSITSFGALSQWAINVINILTGNFNAEGGVLFTNPGVPLAVNRKKKKRFARWHSRVRQLPEFSGELPVAALAEEILEPGEGQIKAMITSCGNIVLSGTNGKEMDKALSSLDFMVSFDIYLNETTRHADIILPPATGLETAHFSMFFQNYAIRNTIKYSEPSVEKAEGTLFDHEIFDQLLSALEKEKAKRAGVEYELKKRPNLEQTLDFMLSQGPHGYTIAELKKHPHGIDLGPLMPQPLAQKLQNENPMIDLFPELYQKDFARLAEAPIPEGDQLLLISRRSLRSMNSWLHNSERMVKGPVVCTAQIHPSDAQKRNVQDGQNVTVKSRIGEITIQAEITEEVGPGTVCIPHGWGHNRPGTAQRIAAQNAGASYADLADQEALDELCGNAALSALPVEVF
ncbi:MAG: molybdopterin-dependent oxidoreductase [Bacteroidota bacterium]